jgi:hypothetical protein
MVTVNEVSTLKSFSIDQMTVDYSGRDNRDSINMKAKFALPDGVTFDPTKDEVVLDIDGFAIDIPAGSFKANGSKYNYDSPKGVEPKTSVALDFRNGNVNLVVRNANVDIINNADGVTVTFSIRSIVGTQNINMFVDDLTYPKQR